MTYLQFAYVVTGRGGGMILFFMAMINTVNLVHWATNWRKWLMGYLIFLAFASLGWILWR